MGTDPATDPTPVARGLGAGLEQPWEPRQGNGDLSPVAQADVQRIVVDTAMVELEERQPLAGATRSVGQWQVPEMAVVESTQNVSVLPEKVQHLLYVASVQSDTC